MTHDEAKIRSLIAARTDDAGKPKDGYAQNVAYLKSLLPENAKKDVDKAPPPSDNVRS